MSSDHNRVLSGEVGGSSFESFLEEAGIAEEVYAVALERVSAWLAKEGVRTASEDQEPAR